MARKFALITVFLILAVTSGMVSCTPKVGQETPTDFYRGKTIELVSNSSAGSLNDLILRTIATYLNRDTGATVIVNNRQGAGGLEGVNYLYKANPDGLTLGMTGANMFVTNKVLDDPAAVYEIEDFSYIISIGRLLTHFFVSPEGPCQSVADLQAAKDLKLGASTASGYVSLAGLTIIKILGLDGKVITGFQGQVDRALATKRGEITGFAINISTARNDMESGMIKPIFVLATKRDLLAPDVPAITELVKLSDEDLALVKLWETTLVGSALFVAPPGTPKDRLEFLRDLASKWVEDEEFRKQINTISGYELQSQEYVTGDEVAKSMLDVAAALDKFRAIFDELIEKYRA